MAKTTKATKRVTANKAIATIRKAYAVGQAERKKIENARRALEKHTKAEKAKIEKLEERLDEKETAAMDMIPDLLDLIVMVLRMLKDDGTFHQGRSSVRVEWDMIEPFPLSEYGKKVAPAVK